MVSKTRLSVAMQRNLSVSAENIEKGMPGCPTQCAMGHALHDIGARFVYCNGDRIEYSLKGFRYRHTVSPTIIKFQKAFDRGLARPKHLVIPAGIKWVSGQQGGDQHKGRKSVKRSRALAARIIKGRKNIRIYDGVTVTR